MGIYSRDERRAANHTPGNSYCTILSALMPLSSCANWSRRPEATRRRITCPVRSSWTPSTHDCHMEVGAAQHSTEGSTKTQDKPIEAFLGILSREGFSRRFNGQGSSRPSATPLEGLSRRHALGWSTTRTTASGCEEPRKSEHLSSANWAGFALDAQRWRSEKGQGELITGAVPVLRTAM